MYTGVGGTVEGKRSLGRPRHRYNNIKIELKEMGLDGVDWINLAQDRDKWLAFVNSLLKIWVQ